MTFTDLFVRRPVLALVVSTLILLFGALALSQLPIRQYPLLENSTITISTDYPGASSELMQGFVTQPIAQAVSSVEGVDYLSSSSVQGRSVVTVRMALNRDSTQALTEVMAKVNQVRYKLPEQAYDPVIERSAGEATAVAYVGFSSKTLSTPVLSEYLTRVVEPMFTTIDGVAKVEVFGGQKMAMRLWLDSDRLAGRGLTAADVADAVRRNNYQAAPGKVKGQYVVANVRVNTDLTSVEEFRNLVVRNDGNGLVRLKDVGTVELGAAATETSALMDGEPAVFLGVFPTPTGNPLVIVDGIRHLMPAIDKMQPPGVKMALAFETARFIQASIDEVVHTLLEALAIVVAVIYLCLGSLRTVLIPVVTIPLSILGAAGLMLAFGFSVNLLTLLAMVLAIGLVVDDAIVVVENVHRHIEEGKTPLAAAMIGAREVAGPVIAMTLTLAAVYAPIGLMGGLTGALFREFALTLAGAVVVSGVVALTLSPVMSSLLLPAKQSEGRVARAAEWFFGGLTRRYARAGFLAAPPLGDRRAGSAGDDQPAAAVPDAAARAGADRGSGHRTDRHQGATARQPELCRAFCVQAGRGLQPHAGNRKPLDHQRQRRHRVRHRRHQPDAVAGAPALGVSGAGRSAEGGERRRRHQHFRLPTARAAGLHRRAAGADGAAHAAGLPAAVSHPGRGEAERQKQRPVYGGGQRSGLQQPAGGGAYRSCQGQQPRDPHERYRRIAGGAGGGELPQPLRHGRARL